jgi:pimeloyl-ACP methyl ester carboxylesterase
MKRQLMLLAGLLLFAFTRAYGGESADFDSDGVRIHYTVEGKGEPVLLVHGFSVNSQFQWVFPGIVKALAKDYQVICFDCRGHGLSGKPYDPAKYGMEMCEDAIRLLDHLHIRKVHVVGYSLGGFIALKLLAIHPERFLTATTGGAGASAQITPDFLEELAQSLESGNGITPLIKLLTPAGRAEPTPAQLKTINQLFSVFNDPKALAAVMRGMKGLTLTAKELQSNQVPTLALVGDCDPFKRGIDELKSRVPNFQVVVIKDSDHMDAFLKPEFTQLLRAFLARNQGSRRAGEAR